MDSIQKEKAEEENVVENENEDENEKKKGKEPQVRKRYTEYQRMKKMLSEMEERGELSPEEVAELRQRIEKGGGYPFYCVLKVLDIDGNYDSFLESVHLLASMPDSSENLPSWIFPEPEKPAQSTGKTAKKNKG